MKSVFIAGSRKFYADIENLVGLCKQNGIKAQTAGKLSGRPDTFQTERSALLRAFKRIERSDILYVMAKDGYAGKTVAMEIAYAFSRKKPIVSSEAIEDFSARSLVSRVASPEVLIRLCR